MKLRLVSRDVRGGTRRLLEHHESIRPAKAERIDRGEPRTMRRPVMALAVDEKRAGREVDFRVRSSKIEARRDFSVLQHQGHLDQRSDARGLLEMPNIRLDRADRAVADSVRFGPEGPGKRIDFQGVADDRACPMTFD